MTIQSVGIVSEQRVVDPARPGDIAVIEVERVTCYSDFTTRSARRYLIGCVSGVRRNGAVSTVVMLTGGDLDRGRPERRNRSWLMVWIVPQHRIDVLAVEAALRAEPRDAFDSLESARTFLRAFLRHGGGSS